MNIKNALIVVFLLIALCGFFFTSFYNQIKKESIKTLNNEQLLHARQAARGIEDFFTGWTEILTTLSETDHIRNMDGTGIKNMERLYKDNGEMIRAVTRVDTKGRIIYTIPYDRSVIGKDISSQKHIREIMAAHRPVVSDVFFAVQGYSTIAIHVPVFRDNKYNGTIGIGINFQSLAKRYLENIKIGQTGYAWVISRDGMELFCPVPGHVGNSVFKNCKDFPSIIAMAEEMLKGREGTTVYTFDKVRDASVEVVKKHAVYIPVHIGNTFWSIVVASSEDELLSSIRGFRNKLIMVVAFIFLGGVLLSFYWSKAMFTIREERKRLQMEEALRESEERYRLISENMMDIICLHDSSSRYLYVSPSLKTVMGYSPEEVLGKSPYDFLEPEDIEGMLVPSHHRVTNDKIPDVAVYRARKKDGSYIWLETKIKPVLSPDGSLRYVLTASRDITERKQTEDALKLSEEKYRNIFENAVMGIFQTTPGGKLLNVNPAGARMYGYESPEEMIKSVTDMAHQLYVNPADRTRLIQMLDDKGCIEGYEVENYSRNGGRIWVSMNVRAFMDAYGTVIYYDTTSHDITEHKRLESQLLQSRKMEAVGTLAGGIAHDFNNILSAVMGYSSLIQMKMKEDDPLYHYLKQIILSTEKAAGLTQSLLAFSRKQFINPGPMDLNEAIAKAGKLLTRLITEDIELKITLEPEKLIILADTGQIDQVILNLVTNARDAMPDGGIITVGTRKIHLDDKFKSIHGFGTTGDYAEISVSDTGAGMDATTKEKIFEPFFTTKEVGKGTGLGMSIVYGIVQQHNGFIDVSSEPGQGTTFFIYLPLTTEEMEEKTEQPEGVLRGIEKILLAEDNTELRSLAKTVLEDNGYTVIEARDGNEAIAGFREHMPDLTILDVVMPKKNGKQVYDEIKEMKSDLKVLFTSGYTDDIIYQKGIIEEGMEFISKPFSPKEMLLKIRKILDKGTR